MSTAKGRKAEEQATQFLLQQGYEVLARNVRAGRGELDIIAKQGDILVFVEVKGHRTRDASLQAVTEDKCMRLRSAAEAWLYRHPQHAPLQCRFDLIMVSPPSLVKPWVGMEHMQDVFR